MPVPYLDDPPEVIVIDVGRQLFVDDFLIGQTNLQRVYHTAQYHPGNPVLKADRPWEDPEGTACAHPFSDGVWYDPQDKIFKMWYMSPDVKGTCYATSRDGINWEKPSLDVVPGTNIVFQDDHRDSAIVWLDHWEKDPQKRFKISMAQRQYKDRFVMRHSPDGIHWSDIDAESGVCYDRSTFFYNPFRKVWVFSIKGRPPGGPEAVRTRHYWEGPDFVASAQWERPKRYWWVGADRLDPRRPDFDVPREIYNLDGVAYESLMLGLFTIWQGPDNGTCTKLGIHKRNEVLLGFSRDGFHWHRPDRRAFIGVDETPGSWNHGNVQSAGGCCLVVGDKLYFYFSGRAHCKPEYPGSCASTGLAILRRDGFASMDADNTKGVLTTRPLQFSGKHLLVNLDADRGQLLVEVLDKDGQVIAPFTRDNCLPVSEDSTITGVRWRGGHDLSSLAGKPVRFRFHLTRGQLYAFWVSPDASGASHGYVAAGGPGFPGPTDKVGREAYGF